MKKEDIRAACQKKIIPDLFLEIIFEERITFLSDSKYDFIFLCFVQQPHVMVILVIYDHAQIFSPSYNDFTIIITVTLS